VSRYQKGTTNLDFTEARDSEWQWHQLGHMQVCTSLQRDNHVRTPPLKFFYRPDALPAAQPTASNHCHTIRNTHREAEQKESIVLRVHWYCSRTGRVGMGMCCEKKTMTG